MATAANADHQPTSTSFCKFLLEGRCMKGKECKFRHHGPERPISTVYASEVLALKKPESKVERLIPHGVAPGSYTMVLPSGIKATFTDGVKPTHIMFLDELRPKIKMLFVVTQIEVNCYQPCHIIWLLCKDVGHAQAIHAALHSMPLQGVKLDCKMQSCIKKRQWTVEITNATESINCEQVVAMLPAGVHKPLQVRSGPPSYDPMTNVVEAVLATIATKTNRTVTGSEMSHYKNKTKFKVVFELEGNPNLSLIARTLNEEKVAELGGSRLYAQERTKVLLSIDRHAYKKQARRLKHLSSSQRRAHNVVVHFDEKSPETQPIEVIIHGSDRTAVLRAKAAIDSVFITDMAAVLERLQPTAPTPPKTHRIDLDKAKDYIMVTNSGLAEAKSALGKKVVRLDSKSDPPAVVVRGDVGTMSKVHGILFPGRDDGRYSSNCLICTEPADDAVTVPGCEHIACKDCFVQYCTVGAKFPLRCFGCNTVVSMNFLRKTLDEDNLNLVLQQALADHFVGHHHKYAQCPGFECNAFYKVSSDTGEMNCPSCFTVVCTKCQVEQHFEEDCTTYQARTSSALLSKEALEKAGAKRCKGCQTIVQKSEGCNNMDCPGCRAHFCWHCLEIFPTHGDVYAHLTAVHGGWFDPGEGIGVEGEDIGLPGVVRIDQQLNAMAAAPVPEPDPLLVDHDDAFLAAHAAARRAADDAW